jgi:hypothetical protein
MYPSDHYFDTTQVFPRLETGQTNRQTDKQTNRRTDLSLFCKY